MALDVGTLVANLKLDRSDFNRGVQESEGTFSRLGGALATGAKRIATLGGAAIAAAGAVGLSTAARMEQAEIGFTTMLGSGEKAKAFLGELSAFAAKTPFEFPELQTAASSLVSAGVEANRVIPIMTSLGNATSGMGTGSEGVKRATVALQQMNAAGKITGEDLNQLRDAGIPVYDLLAAATGKSKEAVAELAQKGKLGRKELEQLMGALESGKGLERFNGLMEAQSQSLTGLWSTLKDNFSQGMADAIQPLIPLIKQGLGGAITFTAAAVPRLREGVADLVAGLQGSGPIDGFSGRLNTLGLGLRAVVFAFQDGDVTSDGFVGKMEQVGVGLAGVVAWAREAKGTVGVFVDAFRGRSEVNEFDGALRAVNNAGISIRDGLAAARAAVVGLFPAKATGEGIDWAAAIEKGQAAAGRLWPQIQAAATQMQGLSPVVDVTGAVFGFLADHIDTVIKYMPLLLAAFVAYKTAQTASNLAALASLPIQAATVASNFAAAGANRALATAIGQQTAIQNANQVATTRGTLATIASTVARGAHTAATTVSTAAVSAYTAVTNGSALAHVRTAAATVGSTVALAAHTAGMWIANTATKAWAAGQWLLNAALTGNPIGAVVVAIAALVGGLVLAWRESETFRRIVVGAVNGVKDVTLSVVGALVGAWFWWADKLLLAAEKALGWIPGIGDKVKAARAGMAAVGQAIQGEIDKIKGKDIELDVKAKGSWSITAARAANEHQGHRRAQGGPVHGPGTGTSDSVPAVGPGGARYLLSNGEHVWTAAEVAKLGGHQAMLQLRGMVARGEVRAYRSGGAVTTRALPGTASVAPAQYAAVERELVQRVADAAADRIEATRRAAAAAVGGSGVAGRGNVDAELLRRFDAWNASLGGVLRIVSGYRSAERQRQLYAAYLAGRGNLAARPGTSKHERSPAEAIDYGPANWARTATAYRFGIAAPVRSEPWHLELARRYDAGGVARGTGMMPKFTPRPERVLSPRQTEAFERLVGALDRAGGRTTTQPAVFHLYGADGVLIGTMRGVAEDVMADEHDAMVYGRTTV